MTERSPKANPTLEARLLSGLSEMSGCMEWQGYICGDTGYGKISNRPGNPISTHVAAWITNRGPIPEGLLVRHKCDNRSCASIEHLELGTQSDNVNDMMSRGRFDNYKERISKCPSGHAYNITDHQGYRGCGICKSIQARRYQAKINDRSDRFCKFCWFIRENCKCDELDGLVIPGVRYTYKGEK